MNYQFTETVMELLSNAVNMAKGAKQTEVTEHHVLLAGFADQGGYFWTISNALGLNPASLINALKQKVASLATFSGRAEEPNLSQSLNQILYDAYALIGK